MVSRFPGEITLATNKPGPRIVTRLMEARIANNPAYMLYVAISILAGVVSGVFSDHRQALLVTIRSVVCGRVFV